MDGEWSILTAVIFIIEIQTKGVIAGVVLYPAYATMGPGDDGREVRDCRQLLNAGYTGAPVLKPVRSKDKSRERLLLCEYKVIPNLLEADDRAGTGEWALCAEEYRSASTGSRRPGHRYLISGEVA